MEKELLELFESAKKAADAAAADGVTSGGPEEDRCVDALKRLKKFPVTMQVLVATQVGKRLRHLTKHPREKIQAVASDLLEIWKGIVMEETAKNKKNGSDNKTSQKVQVTKSETVKVEKTQKAGSVNIEKVSRSETVSVEKTDQGEKIKSAKVSKSETLKVEKKVEKDETARVDKMPKEEKSNGIKQTPSGPPKLTSMIKCNDATRDKIRELLAEALSKVPSEADPKILDEVKMYDPIRVAVSVESVLFEKMGRSNGSQKFKYRSIMFNIKDPKNPDLRRRVLLGHIKPERLIDMTPDEMASDQRKQENNQIKEKALFECERGGQAQATTDQFKCGRCGQRKTTYYQMQTRSADEPMTTYVTCVNCNNHWKFC
ncbi:zinc finger protein [Macleaya cordata]|uniref:Transcription elongation factor n=1 Tax=Macleaya cordata TaxID=56857 RepID=A0A200QTB0_MACCD|nr:zinc finger protein [Macleaya cordata]